MQTRKLAPALAAGCTAVIKAPPETPLSALALAALVEQAGFPKGVVNILTTNKNTVDVGYEMTTNADVRKVSFTGSSPVGALLMKQASSTLKKCSFELGGNAIFAVFADADIPKAVDGLIASKFRLSGQTCVCANRIFIHEDVYDEFAKQFIAKGAFSLLALSLRLQQEPEPFARPSVLPPQSPPSSWATASTRASRTAPSSTRARWPRSQSTLTTPSPRARPSRLAASPCPSSAPTSSRRPSYSTCPAAARSCRSRRRSAPPPA